MPGSALVAHHVQHAGPTRFVPGGCDHAQRFVEQDVPVARNRLHRLAIDGHAIVVGVYQHAFRRCRATVYMDNA
ncbi:MAG: hypothetical protein AUI15_05455 [Actinobacteria bacterium 13_2_20CM_2_66_6]|nr:MAG: hypothetical protein AUI15_05455 [Actinobacteria bacterium 13_2_20CM_2_66_6]